ncbi:MAG TPA: dienelactone hydrolase family protein [bacterium]|nr:dienelactone hydrolase family protein [bacterium]
MSDLQRYIVEEWAEDFQAGRLPRREFLRRTVLMAGGAAMAIPILHSLGVSASADEVAAAAQAPAPAVAQATGVTVPPDDPALSAAMVSFASGGIPVHAYLARPRGTGAYPAVLVIHENRGLLDHFKDVSRRLAKLGYAGLAVDLASAEGGTAKFSDPAEVTAVLGRTPAERMVEMLNAAVRYLRGLTFVQRDRIGVMGYCFGGGMTWRLATQNADLRAAVPYYGPNPPIEDVAKIKAAVLAIYGEQDTRINAGIPAVREAMQKAGVTHEIVIYPNADHAFFNDTGQRYNAAAARSAWERTTGWLQRYLKS